MTHGFQTTNFVRLGDRNLLQNCDIFYCDRFWDWNWNMHLDCWLEIDDFLSFVVCAWRSIDDAMLMNDLADSKLIIACKTSDY